LPRDALSGVGILKLGLAPERSLLYQHLDERSASLFANGLLSETRAHLDLGYSPEAKPLQSLGYKQAIRVLTGDLSTEEAIRECQTRTRQYAKRQMTWFRRERGVHWLAGFGSEQHVRSMAAQLANTFLRA
jgi:tRNA dimethylallyltransferase